LVPSKQLQRPRGGCSTVAASFIKLSTMWSNGRRPLAGGASGYGEAEHARVRAERHGADRRGQRVR
jgi:hypothetical protein